MTPNKTAPPNDPDLQLVHNRLDRLATEKFYGQVTVKFAGGKITSAKQEETLALPSYALREASKNAPGHRNDSR